MKRLTVFLLLIGKTLSWSQAPPTEGKVKLTAFSAQFLVSTDFKKAMYINLVGSGIKYSWGNSSLQLGVFPTLRFYEYPRTDATQPKKPFVMPGFSAGLLYSYKRFMIATPTYFKDDAWHYTIGMGVKIGQFK